MRGDLVRLALGSFLFCCNALVASGASAQTSTDFLAAEQVKKLVSGRTWAIGWQRDLANAATVTHWDFKADGTVCARFIGAKAKDKCADDGKWQLRGEVLCWELQRIGEFYGFKAACVRVRKVDEKRYEAIAEDGRLHPPLFYPVK
jgi:hypothetical protein